MKDKSSNYLIYALICLLIFNIGSIFIYRIKGYYVEPETAQVFNPVVEVDEVIEKEGNQWDKSIFLFKLFSHSSSIINLHEKDMDLDQNILRNFVGYLPLFKDVQKLVFNKSPDNQDMNYDIDIENSPEFVEDFVLIDEFEGYENIVEIKGPLHEIDISQLPQPIGIKPLKIDKSKESILLYHTHATESYHPTRENNYHTTKEGLNILSVGEVMTESLETFGYKANHSKTIHDNPSYNKSYTKSLATIKEELGKNDNLKVLIDIHRDGVEEDTSPNAKAILNSRMEIDGKSVATFFFVIGPDAENYEELLAFAKYIKVVSDMIYPGYCTGILVKPRGKFNLYHSDYSALIEVGNNLNTLEEAKESAKVFAKILSLVIEKLES